MKSIRSVGVAAVALCISTASIGQTVQDPSVQCSLDMAGKPEFSQLSGKLPVGDIRDITFAMLASDAKPTIEERNEIAALFAAKEQCGKLGESFRQAHYPPEVNNQLDASITAFKLIGVDLYKGEISYGEANKRMATVRDDLVSKLAIIVQAYKKEMEAQRAQTAALQAQAQNRALQASIQQQQASAEQDAQRQRRNQMILNYLQANRPYQLPAPPNLQIRQSTTSNCFITGNQASCTSN
jgi:hypothetical protein